MTALPVLDLSRLDAGPSEAAAFRADLAAATHEVGFFYLTGHGIPRPLQDDLLRVSREFFALADEDKLAIENVNSPHFRGYTRIGGELTQGQVDWREQIDIGPERAALDPASHADYWRLQGLNQWPQALPELRRVVDEWEASVTQVAQRLLGAWAEALGQPSDVFDEAFADASFLLKIVRYPGRRGPAPEQGVGAHKDSGVLTLLWVEPGKGGLQVEYEGGFIDAPPVEGAFIVNIGELLEHATGGYLRATVHRVESPPAGSDRISIPFFFNPRLDAQIPTLALPAELTAEARGVEDDPSNPIHDTYGANALKSRLRAHPDVAERHHADLLARR